MNQQQPELPEPDPRAASLESLKMQLRALPPPAVPAELAGRLIAAIPPVSAAGAAAGVWKVWPWMAAIGGAGVVAAALTYTWMANRNPRAVPAVKAQEGATENSTSAPNASSIKAVRDAEQAVGFDPYNAEAWFALAKAQAAANQPEAAVSSAEKAMDVARSRERSDLAQTIEMWLRSHRKAGGTR
jgi:hypothetical protein